MVHNYGEAFRRRLLQCSCCRRWIWTVIGEVDVKRLLLYAPTKRSGLSGKFAAEGGGVVTSPITQQVSSSFLDNFSSIKVTIQLLISQRNSTKCDQR